ncbi:hypothetical protein [Pseudidiomarina donghaiensis]|uniref:Lipoprotein n=1 Tax=Pseudidiomarina donghaiensis TaxID=519452 RepID=A0A432XJR4_9GAMM|nr:hypothetical protein [Pseudidiomarina donghaiensis]RUO48973.1 hypothetical protein CWE24_00185 [Pseudidiomarina donghaiensis]SFV20349.1 hypothetical protein SAMN04488139_0170 [Pseudidiomarina donghaiensis]
MNYLIKFISFVFLISISACTGNDKVERCVARGVEYFKEIGSYPTLKSGTNAGRTAESVATERCKKKATAF